MHSSSTFPSAGRRRYLPYRRAAFLLQALVIVGLPFLEISGESAFRFDIPSLRLHFFGQTLWIQEFFLFLLVTLWLTFLIVFATVVLGRLWCGWLCPQSAIIELVDWVGDLLRLGGRRRNVIRHALTLILSALVSATLIWYFVPPGDFFTILASPAGTGNASRLVWGFFIGQWLIIYGEVALLGRRFCATICPYGKLQGALFDRDTLIIEFDRDRSEDCRACDLCVRVCPTGMDIKDGLSAECIACARCIDACRAMTEARDIPSLVRYRWGGWRRLGRPAVVLLSLALALLFSLTAWQIHQRRPLEFTVSRATGMLHVVSPSGVVLNHFRLHVQNKSGKPADVSLNVEPGEDLRLMGPSQLHLEPGEDGIVPLPVALVRDRGHGSLEIRFVFTEKETGTVYLRKGTFFLP